MFGSSGLQVILGESSAQVLQRKRYKYFVVCAFYHKSIDGFIRQHGTCSHNQEN